MLAGAGRTRAHKREAMSDLSGDLSGRMADGIPTMNLRIPDRFAAGGRRNQPVRLIASDRKSRIALNPEALFGARAAAGGHAAGGFLGVGLAVESGAARRRFSSLRSHLVDENTLGRTGPGNCQSQKRPDHHRDAKSVERYFRQSFHNSFAIYRQIDESQRKSPALLDIGSPV